MKSGRLDAAQSKAKVLQQLCEQLKFNPEAAAALHRSLYRQKIDGILEEKKKISGKTHRHSLSELACQWFSPSTWAKCLVGMKCCQAKTFAAVCNLSYLESWRLVQGRVPAVLAMLCRVH